MKPTIFILAVLLSLLQSINAQVPTIGGHDDWCVIEPIAFDDPDCWESSNPVCVAAGLPDYVLLTEDAYSGTYALRLETGIDADGMPFPSAAIFKNKLQGRPEKLTGYYLADLKADDYSSIRISLTSDRGIVGWGSIEFDRSSSLYTAFEIPLVYISPVVVPDSFYMAIYSSAEMATSGTYIVFDDLAFETVRDVAIPLTEKYTNKLTPNPATDEILVQVPGELGQVYLKIFDDSGRNMEYETFEYQVRIDVSDYTQGLYLYEIRLKSHELYDKGRFKVVEHGF
jgi:hypothetical protein